MKLKEYLTKGNFCLQNITVILTMHELTDISYCRLAIMNYTGLTIDQNEDKLFIYRLLK